jgi:hypothetical protein
MDSHLSNRIRIASGICALLAFIVSVNSVARGQDKMFVPSPAAPPPMKFISGNERAQLSGARDVNSRTKLSIEIAETRLMRAEQFVADQRFVTATTELGMYQAVVEDALRFLGRQKADSNKTRDLYKRLEIKLREHLARVESIRRVTPSEYALHVRDITEFVRDARTNALNAFFSDTVLQQNADGNETSSARESAAGSTSNPQKKQP